jgi:protein tyrosine/serine phosphatase
MTVMRVEAEYLAESFAAIREENGSLDGYLQAALGLDADLRARVRDRLLA